MLAVDWKLMVELRLTKGFSLGRHREVWHESWEDRSIGQGGLVYDLQNLKKLENSKSLKLLKDLGEI